MSELRKLDIKAVILGFLTDTVATVAISVVLVSAMAGLGIAEHDITDRMNSLNGLLLSFIVGMGCTVLGGYVAGRVAKRAEILHGAVVAGAGVILGLAMGDNSSPLWYEVVSYACIFPAGMIGGRLASQRNARALAKQDK